jgi:hypothetical protein
VTGASAPGLDSGPLHGPADTRAKLLLYTRSVDPAVVTSGVGVVPTKTVQQGEPSPSGRAAARYGMWELSSEDRVGGLDVAAHVRCVLDTVAPAAEALAALRRAHPDWRALLSIHWFQDVARAGFVLPAPLVAGAGALGVDLRVGVILASEENAVEEEQTHARFALGQWAVSSSDAVDSDRMDDHLTWIVDATAPLLPALRASSSRPAARITGTYARRGDNTSITVPAPVLGRLTTMGADLAFDLMTAPDDD